MSNSNSISRDKSAPAITPTTEPLKKKRGFAAMDPTEVSILARRGGIAAHRNGNAHEFTSDEARAAGRKGGVASHFPRSGSGQTRTEPTN
jgi:general stress protein YciG